MYGERFATIPAYLADIFGTRWLEGIQIEDYKRTAWSTAGVLGPLAITQLRQKSFDESIADLASKVDPEIFKEKFGESIDNSSQLVSKNCYNIESDGNCARRNCRSISNFV